MFSKLDLRWGFHQIELEPNSRDITSFATDYGIFRYKRLSFGVNAAPEKYQHIFTQTMAGLKGVANIANDLVVHGKDSEEHDRNLIKVLERLKERGLTVSAEKCTFRMTKVIFVGLLLTRHGIGSTKEKARAVVDHNLHLKCEVFLAWLDLVPGSYLSFQPLLNLLRRLQDKENHLSGVESKRSHFKS